MKILIIGSQGFIGSNCLKYFQSDNNVFCCDITGMNEKNYLQIDYNNPDFDLIFQKNQPDVCINASGSGDVGFSFKYPEKDFILNVKNVQGILDAIKKYSPFCKMINFSSAAVYGNPKQLPVNESAETNPLSPYGKHKLESEKLLKHYHDEYKLKTCSLRVFSAYGAGLKKQLFWNIYEKINQTKKINLFGTGNESRDFIYVDDLMRAIDCIIKKNEFDGEPINVSSGVESFIHYAAQYFISLYGSEYILEFSGEEKKGDPKNWKADISKLRKLGFAPFITFEEGIRKYFEWLKKSK